MMPDARGSSVLHDAGELLESGTERTKDLLDAARQRAHEAFESADVEPARLGASMGRAVAQASGREVDCTQEIEAAEDRFRLKAAIVTGIVAFILSSLVFLVAREVVRRAERRRAEQRYSARGGEASERRDPLATQG